MGEEMQMGSQESRDCVTRARARSERKETH